MSTGEDAAPDNFETREQALAEAARAARHALDELAKALGADPQQAFAALERAGREAGAGGVEKFSDSVRRHPLAWIAGALGLGLILGLWRKS